MTTKHRFLAAFVAALGAVAFTAPQAMALIAFWKGARSNSWHDGVSGDTSNWYDALPVGNPVGVPDVFAGFTGNGQTRRVVVKKNTEIKEIWFEGNLKYTIEILRRLSITGVGISNRIGGKESAKLRVIGGSARLLFENWAEASIAGSGARPVWISNEKFAETQFRDNSSASFSRISNKRGGAIVFYDTSSAEYTKLVNEKPKSVIAFRDASESVLADIINKEGEVFLDQVDDKRLLFRKIENQKKMVVGRTAVTVTDTLDLGEDSVLTISWTKKGGGTVTGNKKAKLDGKLIVIGANNIRTGIYQLISAPNKFTGKFKNVVFKGFGRLLKKRIVYNRHGAYLQVAKK